MMNTPPSTIAAATIAAKTMTTCARLLALAGLDEMLRGQGQYTLFAPTDRAFDELPVGTLAALESDRKRLRATLEYHILCVGDIAQIRNQKVLTLEGTLLTVSVTDDGLLLDHANVCARPVRCTNGVIYPLGAVLFPGFTPEVSATVQRLTQDSPWSGGRRASRTRPALAATTAQAAAAALFDTPPIPRAT